MFPLQCTAPWHPIAAASRVLAAVGVMVTVANHTYPALQETYSRLSLGKLLRRQSGCEFAVARMSPWVVRRASCSPLATLRSGCMHARGGGVQTTSRASSPTSSCWSSWPRRSRSCEPRKPTDSASSRHRSSASSRGCSSSVSCGYCCWWVLRNHPKQHAERFSTMRSLCALVLYPQAPKCRGSAT